VARLLPLKLDILVHDQRDLLFTEKINVNRSIEADTTRHAKAACYYRTGSAAGRYESDCALLAYSRKLYDRQVECNVSDGYTLRYFFIPRTFLSHAACLTPLLASAEKNRWPCGARQCVRAASRLHNGARRVGWANELA